MKKTAIELFAGVGGFRVGLNDVKLIDGKTVENGPFEFVYANQWEPATKGQPAFDCYDTRFPSDHNSNEDIASVDKATIPDHTLLTGGFPCQDYSVAHGLSTEKGIEGKKGVLWWQILEILKVKAPPVVLLENVDRLIKAPARKRGRDFGIILRCFYEQGYCLDWRVINAADYGFPQRRRRIFLFAYKKDTEYAKALSGIQPIDVLLKGSIFAKAFPVEEGSFVQTNKTKIRVSAYKDILKLQEKFEASFGNAGHMDSEGLVTTGNVDPIIERPTTLGDILDCDNVPEWTYLTKRQIKQFDYLKGAKKITRTARNGHRYIYSEGPIANPDYLDRPGRTMLTSEGTVNRSTHLVLDPKTNRKRILTPVECERLNMFPDNWTATMRDKARYFMMGNALVCGIIKRLSPYIAEIIEAEP